MARCNSRRKTYLAEYSQQSRSFYYSHWNFLWLTFKSWLFNPALIYDCVVKRVRPGYVRTPSVWIDPWTSVRMDCDVIDVNSTPDESAKEYCYFHMHGSHLYLSLAWSFPSPSFGRLCSHVAVALAWLPHLSKHALTLNQKRFRQIDNEQYNSHTDPCAAHVRILYYVT